MYSEDEVVQSTMEYFGGDELATNVWVSKYALRDKEGNLLEKTPSDMHNRIADEFARVEKRFGGKRALKKKDIYDLLDNFKYIVPQGSPMYGIGNKNKVVSLSNCVVIESPEDTMSSIFDVGKNLANLYKRRCGVGLDISTLRPDGARVNNAANTSSGAWSFADFFSYITRMVGQSSRRGALMTTMDVRHPDIRNFITMKHDLTKVTGANVSVRLSDDFMKAVESNDDFELKFPCESKNPLVSETVKAKDIWKLIIDSATKTAEPGILMWDNVLKYMPAESYADVGFKTCSTNPCSEITLSPFDSCRLISINLKHFVEDKFTNKAKFDYKKFSEVVSAGMRLSDDLVELELEKLSQIKDSCDDDSEKELWGKLEWACKNGRRTGLGTHGLADTLACLNLAYDSDEGLEVIDKIYKTLKVSAYSESVELAKERGSFPVFDWEKEKSNKYIKSLPKSLRDNIAKNGRRNISILTNAPTGSVSLVSQTSSGLEPVFKNAHIRRKKINHSEEGARVDYTDDLGDKWQEFRVFHHNVKEYMDTHGLSAKDKLPDFFVESDNINWLRRVEIQGVIQKHVDHALSSTINLPKGTDPKVVGKIYLEGWKRGLKGVTVYVDGSRSGVLVSESENKDKFEYKDALKRPKKLECDIHKVTVKGDKWTIIVGLVNNRPYEVFGGLSEMVEIPKKFSKGFISKGNKSKNKSRYDLEFGEDGVIKDVTKVFDNPMYQVHTRMVSLALRHGTKPSFLVEQLQKDPDNDLTSFSKVLARVLKKYIEDGTRVASTDKDCPDCGLEDGLIYQEGCVLCESCGWTKCM